MHHDNIRRRQMRANPQAPDEVEEEILPEFATVMEAGEPQMPHAADRFAGRPARPRPGNDCDGMSARGKFEREASPRFFGGATTLRRHGQEKSHDNRYLHDGKPTAASAARNPVVVCR